MTSTSTSTTTASPSTTSNSVRLVSTANTDGNGNANASVNASTNANSSKSSSSSSNNISSNNTDLKSASFSSTTSPCSLSAMNKSTLSLLDLAGSMLQMELQHERQQRQQKYSPSKAIIKSVKFGNRLVIREHKLTIADMPWKDGPPVALSWEQVALKHVDLEEYEELRGGVRRLQKDLRTTAADRRTMLKEHGGYSDSDLLRAEKLKKAISLSRSSMGALTGASLTTATTTTSLGVRSVKN